MKHIRFLVLMLIVVSSAAVAQRLYETHTRSMLRQTIYNTGELGRALEGSNSNNSDGLFLFWMSNCTFAWFERDEDAE